MGHDVFVAGDADCWGSLVFLLSFLIMLLCTLCIAFVIPFATLGVVASHHHEISDKSMLCSFLHQSAGTHFVYLWGRVGGGVLLPYQGWASCWMPPVMRSMLVSLACFSNVGLCGAVSAVVGVLIISVAWLGTVLSRVFDATQCCGLSAGVKIHKRHFCFAFWEYFFLVAAGVGTILAWMDWSFFSQMGGWGKGQRGCVHS